MYTAGSQDDTPDAMAEQRRSHFIAGRLLAKQFFPDEEIFKDEFGKPHLKNLDTHFSWSHSGRYAALIADEHGPTGIDIEELSNRVLRIEDKFCNPTDKSLIDPKHHAESLLLIWTAKESMYKLYGRKEVDFKLHMTIEPFVVAEEGRFFARFHKGQEMHRFQLEFEIFNHHIATWVLGTAESSHS